LVSIAFRRILGSDPVFLRYVESAAFTGHPAIQIEISGREAFLIAPLDDVWVSSDDVVSGLIEEQGWTSADSPAQVILLVSVVLLWWLHVDVDHKKQLGHAYHEQVLLPIVRYWDQVWVATSSRPDQTGEGYLALSVASYWHQKSLEFGFALGFDDESELLQAVRYFEPDEVAEGRPSGPSDFDLVVNDLADPGTEVLSRNGCAVSRTDFPEEWRIVRRNGVTATDALKLLRKNGKPSRQRVSLLRRKVVGDLEPYFPAYALGIEREPVIADWLSARLPDCEPNDVLFRGSNPRHLATPDMIGIDFVVEIKVSSQPLEVILSKHSDQVQWQMHVMGVERALVVLEDRYSKEISSEWVERDGLRIQALADAADEFVEKLDVANAIWDGDFDIEDWDFFAAQPADAGAPREEADFLELRSVIFQSSTFQPAVSSSTGKVVFTDLELEEHETETDWSQGYVEPDDSAVDHLSAGNPFREIRRRLGVSQMDFRTRYEFGKMTMVYLETGMYTQVSERQENAIFDLAREYYFDVLEFLRREFQSDSLNEAYKKWQSHARQTDARAQLERVQPPFPFTKDHSPLFFVIRDCFGSVQHFCKVLKVPSITISRHLDGQTLSIPAALAEALVESGYSEAPALMDAQADWVREFRVAP
jgi:hypothetical protein